MRQGAAYSKCLCKDGPCYAAVAATMHSLHRHLRTLWIFAAPILFSPLLFFHSKAMACAYGILVICSFWIVEVVPIPVTSLLPILIFPALGIMPTKDICSAYLKDTSMLFLCTLMISLAVEESKLHQRLALFMLSKFGGNPLCLMVGMMVAVSFISFWISDTATTALMVPITIAILETMMESRVIPIEAMSPRGAALEANRQLKGQGVVKDRLQLDRLSSSDRALCKSLILICAHASLIGGTAMVTSSGPNLVFRQQIHSMFGDGDSGLTFISWMEFAIPPLIFYLTASLFCILAVFYGPRATLKLFTHSSEEDAVRARAAAHSVNKAYNDLGPVSFAEKSVLFWMIFTVTAWIFREPGFVRGWAEVIFGNDGKLLTDTNIGIFVVFVLFIWPKKLPRGITSVVHSCRDIPDITVTSPSTENAEPLLTWSVVQRRFPWSVLLLIGAGFAISEAVKDSCLEDIISDKTRDVLSDVSPIYVQSAVTAVITFVTSFASNVATASVFVPIALNLGVTVISVVLVVDISIMDEYREMKAVALGVHPLYLGLPSAIAPSFSFMFPMATPPNAMVYDTGVLSMLEMASVGLMLNVLCIGITTVNINTWAYWLFDLGTVPTNSHYLRVNSTCIP